jgi:predicted nucleic acid-binding protein
VALLLDTTVLVGVLRGHRPTIARLDGIGDPPFVSAITVEEITRGMRSHERDATAALFEWVIVAEIGEREAQLAGSWRKAFSARGRTLSQADALIAACAHRRGATLATANVKDFPMTRELRVERWP